MHDPEVAAASVFPCNNTRNTPVATPALHRKRDDPAAPAPALVDTLTSLKVETAAPDIGFPLVSALQISPTLKCKAARSAASSVSRSPPGSMLNSSSELATSIIDAGGLVRPVSGTGTSSSRHGPRQQGLGDVYSLANRRLSSAESGCASSAADLVEMMRRIVHRGGRGRKQDSVPQEIAKDLCARYSQLDEAGKEEVLRSLARDFTPTPEAVAAAVSRYTASISPGNLASSPSMPGNTQHRGCDDAKGGGRSGGGVGRGGGGGGGRGEEGVGGGSGAAGSEGRSEKGREMGRVRGHARAHERLREELSPAYETLFRNVVAGSDDGVRFVVDLRHDLLEVMSRGRRAGTAGSDPPLAVLDGSLRSLLQAWFSVGFLELRRITYEDSGGALLEKIARYEAVHPVRSLSELKHRLGRGRRCFAFFHPCLPEEPLVFVHVALLPEVAGSMEDVRRSSDGGGSGSGSSSSVGDNESEGGCKEEEARCAVFYSISSTQKGLQGVQLGNFLIKRVVAQLRGELPQLEMFATLSPIPSFREWLGRKAEHRAALGVDRSELSGELLLTANEAEAILSDNDADNGGGAGAGGSTNLGKTVTLTPDEESRREAKALAVLLSGDGSPVAEAMAAARRNARRASVDGAETIGDRGVGQGGRGAGKMGRTEGAAAMGVKESVQVEGKGKSTAGQKAAESALTRLAARYLVRETVRGKIPDPVANFHVSNGARVERVNWMADGSSRGIDKSFGVMVNYVYDPLEIEPNNRLYLSKGEVPASDEVRELAWSLHEAGDEADARKQPPPPPPPPPSPLQLPKGFL
eukprot:jgi/Undpi1/1444/HiC_scaffold_11.g04835.m1